MRGAIGLFVAALVCIAVAWWVSALPGTVTATIAGTTLQTTTPVAVLLAVVLFLALYIVIRLIAWLISIPRRTGRWRDGRNRVKGEAAMNRTLVALAANDPAAARREADRSRRLLGDTPLTLLLAAQAGKQDGRDDEAAALYELLSERKDSRLLGLRGLLRLAVEREEWERATTIAEQAEKAHPGARWLADERRQLAQQTGQWREALRLAPPDGKAAMAIQAARDESNPKASLALAKQAYDAEPGLVPAAVTYADKLRAAGRAREADGVLRAAWNAAPHPDLAAAFVSDTDNKVKRAQEMGTLVRNNPTEPEAVIAMGRAALEADLPDEARRVLDRGREAGVNDRRFWTLLAEVCGAQGDEAARQEALQHVSTSDADRLWRCSNCGTPQETWHAACDNCHSVGTIQWVLPSEATVARPRLRPAAGLDVLTG